MMMRTAPDREWMDLKGLTGYAAVSERTLREWIHRAVKPLPAVQVGGKILIKRAAFDRWLEAQPLMPADSIDVQGMASAILADLRVQN